MKTIKLPLLLTLTAILPSCGGQPSQSSASKEDSFLPSEECSVYGV